MYGVKRRRQGYSYGGRRKARKTGGNLVGNKAWSASGGSLGRRLGPGPYQTVSYGIQGANREFLKFRTVGTVAIASTSGAFNSFSLKLNSLLDPFGSAGAIKAAGFSQICSATSRYRSYTVMSATVRVIFQSNGSVGHSMFGAISSRANAISAPASQSDMAARPGAKTTFFNYIKNAELRSHMTIAQVVGDTPAAIPTDDTYSALYNADPTTLVVCDVAAQTDDQTTTSTCYAYVEITQYAVVYSLNSQATS